MSSKIIYERFLWFHNQVKEGKHPNTKTLAQKFEITRKTAQRDIEFMRERLGENAYAAFNAITDFASHPPANRCVYRDRHSFQKLAGAWVSAFYDTCGAKDFNLDDYLVSLTKREEKVTQRVLS